MSPNTSESTRDIVKLHGSQHYKLSELCGNSWFDDTLVFAQGLGLRYILDAKFDMVEDENKLTFMGIYRNGSSKTDMAYEVGYIHKTLYSDFNKLYAVLYACCDSAHQAFVSLNNPRCNPVIAWENLIGNHQSSSSGSPAVLVKALYGLNHPSVDNYLSKSRDVLSHLAAFASQRLGSDKKVMSGKPFFYVDEIGAMCLSNFLEGNPGYNQIVHDYLTGSFFGTSFESLVKSVSTVSNVLRRIEDSEGQIAGVNAMAASSIKKLPPCIHCQGEHKSEKCWKKFPDLMPAHVRKAREKQALVTAGKPGARAASSTNVEDMIQKAISAKFAALGIDENDLNKDLEKCFVSTVQPPTKTMSELKRFIADSGATHVMLNFKPLNSKAADVHITTANGIMVASKTGNIPLIMDGKGKHICKDALYCPDLHDNLLSIPQLTSDGSKFFQ